MITNRDRPAPYMVRTQNLLTAVTTTWGSVMSDVLELIETAEPVKLRELQLERLSWSLKHAYENVAVYRKKFDAAGVHPEGKAQGSRSALSGIGLLVSWSADGANSVSIGRIRLRG